MNRLLLLSLCAVGMWGCSGAKARKFLTQTQSHHLIAVIPAVFTADDSPSASDLFDPPSLRKPHRPLGWSTVSRACAGCDAYAFELQNTIYRLLSAAPKNYRVGVLSPEETNARLTNRFFKAEDLTRKNAVELAKELGVDAVLVPTVGLAYRMQPNSELPIAFPVPSGMMVGTLGLGVANERWFPRKLSIQLFDGHEAGILWGIGQERDYDIPYFNRCKSKTILLELSEVFPYRTPASRTSSYEYYPERH